MLSLVWISSIVLLLLVLVATYIYYTRTPKYKLCIMAIFKNEEDYLEEWLQHHMAVGFDHFFLYCNDPNLSKYSYLHLPKYKKHITLIDWTNKVNDPVKLYESIQRQAYFDCVQKYKKNCDYLMMLDIDEFVMPMENITLPQFIARQRGPIKAMRFQRYNFGSSGHVTKPKGRVIDSYTKRERVCSSYKTLINTAYLDNTQKFYGVHDFNYLENKHGKIYNSYLRYNEKGLPGRCEAGSVNEIPFVINHYYTKSKQEYMERCKMWNNGGVNPVAFRKDCDKTFEANDVSEVSTK